MAKTPQPVAVQPVLRVSDLAVSLGGRSIWHGVTFDVFPGDFIGLIGTNGTGKTTLLKAVLGTIRPAQGTIEALGRSHARGSAIGYVPQKVQLDPDLPLRAKDVVALGLDGYRLGLPIRGTATWQRIDEIIDAVGATAFANQRVGRLSGGQQQRILLAHALVSDPKLILLDEPLANLDPGSAQEIVALLTKVCRDMDVAVLISAHDMNPVLDVMDRIIYLAGGDAAVGSTEEVVRSDVLTKLYGRPIQVLHAGGRVVVVPGDNACHPADAELPTLKEL